MNQDGRSDQEHADVEHAGRQLPQSVLTQRIGQHPGQIARRVDRHDHDQRANPQASLPACWESGIRSTIVIRLGGIPRYIALLRPNLPPLSDVMLQRRWRCRDCPWRQRRGGPQRQARPSRPPRPGVRISIDTTAYTSSVKPPNRRSRRRTPPRIPPLPIVHFRTCRVGTATSMGPAGKYGSSPTTRIWTTEM